LRTAVPKVHCSPNTNLNLILLTLTLTVTLTFGIMDQYREEYRTPTVLFDFSIRFFYLLVEELQLVLCCDSSQKIGKIWRVLPLIYLGALDIAAFPVGLKPRSSGKLRR